MRSKEVSEAIKRINKVREKQFNQFEQTGKTNITIGVNDLRAIDTVLAYIEQLEKMIPTPSNEVPVEYQTLILVDKRDAVMKSEIRDKIKELKEKAVIAQGEELLILEAKIDMLEEIIGE